MANYPTSDPSFTSIVDGVDYPQAADLNVVYEEVTAIGSALRTGLAHDLLPDATANNRHLGSSGAQWAELHVSGDATIGGTLTVAGGEVAFYETDTWTPTDASGAGLTIVNNGCHYVKVGRLVTIVLYVSYPSTASGANAAIGGLPFTSATGQFAGVTAPWTDSSVALGLHVGSATTSILVYGVPGVTQRTNAQMSTISIRASFSYLAAS